MILLSINYVFIRYFFTNYPFTHSRFSVIFYLKVYFTLTIHFFEIFLALYFSIHYLKTSFLYQILYYFNSLRIVEISDSNPFQI
jgi:hypothetical protein